MMFLDKKIVVDPYPGEERDMVVEEAITLSLKHGLTVEFKFNGIIITVKVDTMQENMKDDK